MYKDTVTRTFSIGAVASGTRAADDFSAARRHSSAGVRALLWATSSAKSLGCSVGSDFQTSRENVFPNILTPGSIPQFTIPSLSVPNSLGSCEMERESYGLSSAPSSSSLGFSLGLSDRRAERSVSDPLMKRRPTLQREASYPCPEAQHCLDPASRAALSLQHLTKVTTPYGFVTLSQSPQMASEEALLCQAGLRRPARDEEAAAAAAACGLGKAPEARTVGSKHYHMTHPTGDKKRLSKDSSDSPTKGGLGKAGLKDTAASASPASAARHPDGKLKRRFYKVIKKHFTSCH